MRRTFSIKSASSPVDRTGRSGEAVIVSFANPWLIYKQTQHPEEAKIFLDWMIRPERLRVLYASEPGGKWPVYKSLLDDPIYQENELIQTLAEQTVDYGVDYWYPNNAAAVGIGAMGTSLADIVVNPVLAGARRKTR